MAKRVDWRGASRRAGLPFLALVLLTWAWAWKKGAERPEPDLYPFLKRAWPGADYVPLSRGVFEVKRGGRAVGYAATGTRIAYRFETEFCRRLARHGADSSKDHGLVASMLP